MDNTNSSTTNSERKKLRTRLLAAGLLLAGGAIVAFVYFIRPSSEIDSHQSTDDPRVSFETRFRNVRPGIKYVGDAACGNCHLDIDRTFHQHSMGRSLAPISAIAPNQTYGSEVHNPFQIANQQFFVKRQDDRVTHKEIRLDSAGAAVVELKIPIEFVIGSGHRGLSYLFTRGDRVFQSPISWFGQKKRWDISPGFEHPAGRFERRVSADCLFCHSNYVEPVLQTVNRFKMPLFPRGSAIGCERCHGPGELHVRERNEKWIIPAGGDDSIVNPVRLPPELREAVCQQCHLEGKALVLRRGRGPFDFRPGMPLELFRSIFIFKHELAGGNKAVSQVEQMYVSRCFTQSKGKLGCITCHNPHALPDPEKKKNYFRKKCMACHKHQGCSEAIPVRMARNKDDCIECHMPRNPSADISHTGVTDHRMLRRPRNHPAHSNPPLLRLGDVPIVHFHKNLNRLTAKEIERDLGLALIDLAKIKAFDVKKLFEAAVPYLDNAMKRDSADEDVFLARAYVMNKYGKPLEALRLVEEVLNRCPKHEFGLENATTYSIIAGDQKKSMIYAKRLVEANPWMTQNQTAYAAVLIANKKYNSAVAQCKKALELNPASIGARSLLVTCYLETGQKLRARQEFDTILRLNPPNRDMLLRWFNEQSR